MQKIDWMVKEMKKTLIAAIFTLAMIITLSGLTSVPTQAKSRDYWVRGYCGGMDLNRKQMKAAYHGYKIRVCGYGRTSRHSGNDTKTQALKKRTYKISRKCKVGAGGYERSYKRFLKDRGRTGRLEGFVDLHVRNNQVIYIDYGF